MKRKDELIVENEADNKKIKSNCYSTPLHKIDIEEDEEALLIRKKGRALSYERPVVEASFSSPDYSSSSSSSMLGASTESLFPEPIQNTIKSSRFIPAPDAHRKIKYLLDETHTSPYGDALCEALWGMSISGNNRLLFGKPKQGLKEAHKPLVKTVPVTIKKTIVASRLVDDFYLNPMDWSVNGSVYFGLGNALCAYKPSSQNWKSLYKGINQDSVCISALCATSSTVLYSTCSLVVKKSSFSLMDTTVGKKILTIPNQKVRYAVIRSDETNSNVFYAGNSNGRFVHLDVRLPSFLTPFAEKKVNNNLCGMSLSGDLIAIGDNDNRVRVWDVKKLNSPIFSYNTHNSAVKALAFSPFNSALLASAGGSDDMTIQLVDINKKQLISIQHTDKQTCNVHWVDRNTLFTTHGYSEDVTSNWQAWTIKGEDLTCSGAGPQEEGRILYSTQNPNKSNLFFTGSSTKKLSLVEVGHEKKESPFSFSINSIR